MSRRAVKHGMVPLEYIRMNHIVPRWNLWEGFLLVVIIKSLHESCGNFFKLLPFQLVDDRAEDIIGMKASCSC